MTLPPLPLPALPVSPAPLVTKSIFTSELWGHVLVQLAIFILTWLVAHSTSLPPVAQAVVVAVGPLAMTYLQKNYMSDRSDLKTAALNAGAAAAASVTSAATAAAVLRASP